MGAAYLRGEEGPGLPASDGLMDMASLAPRRLLLLGGHMRGSLRLTPDSSVRGPLLFTQGGSFPAIRDRESYFVQGWPFWSAWLSGADLGKLL